VPDEALTLHVFLCCAHLSIAPTRTALHLLNLLLFLSLYAQTRCNWPQSWSCSCNVVWLLCSYRSAQYQSLKGKDDTLNMIRLSRSKTVLIQYRLLSPRILPPLTAATTSRVDSRYCHCFSFCRGRQHGQGDMVVATTRRNRRQRRDKSEDDDKQRQNRG
jgi:hypothetical protein